MALMGLDCDGSYVLHFLYMSHSYPIISLKFRLSHGKSNVDRMQDKEKTGVFTGSYAINPLNGEKTPIWLADYVLADYGTVLG